MLKSEPLCLVALAGLQPLCCLFRLQPPTSICWSGLISGEGSWEYSDGLILYCLPQAGSVCSSSRTESKTGFSLDDATCIGPDI